MCDTPSANYCANCHALQPGHKNNALKVNVIGNSLNSDAVGENKLSIFEALVTVYNVKKFAEHDQAQHEDSLLTAKTKLGREHENISLCSECFCLFEKLYKIHVEFNSRRKSHSSYLSQLIDNFDHFVTTSLANNVFNNKSIFPPLDTAQEVIQKDNDQVIIKKEFKTEVDEYEDEGEEEEGDDQYLMEFPNEDTNLSNSTVNSFPPAPEVILNVDPGRGYTPVNKVYSTRTGQPSHVIYTSPASKPRPPGLKPSYTVVTGYLIYSCEMRKEFSLENPRANFGEISKIVGKAWHNLPPSEKQVYDERAREKNKEKERQLSLASESPLSSSSGGQIVHFPPAEQLEAMKIDPNWTFLCSWEKCNWQFDDARDLLEHCVSGPDGHVARSFQDKNESDMEFQCRWYRCNRVKKNVPPFQSLHRLCKHVQEVHVMKGNGRIIHPTNRSINYVTSCNKPSMPLEKRIKIEELAAEEDEVEEEIDQYSIRSPDNEDTDPLQSTFNVHSI